jgi:hypothetical protein
MVIQIDPHTLARAKERGASEEEIKEVVEAGKPGLARGKREMRSKIYPFNAMRSGKHYEEKKIEVYYTEEDNKFITVTVYVFYGKWEE